MDRIKEQRIIPVSPEGWGEEEAGWLMIFTVEGPYYLSKRAVELKRIPPYPYSGLPKYIRDQIPEKYHYWKEQDEEKRIQIRDELVKAIKEETVVIKESVIKDFILQFHYSDPEEAIKRGVPAKKHWDLRIDGETLKEKGEIIHLVLEEDPLVKDSVSAYFKPCKGTEGGIDWMEAGKSGILELPPGTPGSFGKQETGYIKAIDWGRVMIMEQSDLFWKFDFRGKKLKGLYILKRSPESDIWTFAKSKKP